MKPILFNTEMVQAIIKDRKTTTRRVIKPQPTYSPRSGFSWKNAEYGTDIPQTIEGAAHDFTKCAAPFQPGDILYVRETWGISGFNPESDEMFVEYKADGANANIVLPEGKFQKYYEKMSEAEPDWHPSIHMPKEATRIFLRVTGVRAERLQEIDKYWSNYDKEGMRNPKTENIGIWMQEKFISIWNNTIKKFELQLYGWAANPWVWVISFERCEKA